MPRRSPVSTRRWRSGRKPLNVFTIVAWRNRPWVGEKMRWPATTVLSRFSRVSRRPGIIAAICCGNWGGTPQDGLLLYSRGTALSELGRQEEAVASFGQALALQPQFGLAIAGRAAALLKLERFAEALAGLDQMLAAKPNDAELLNNRGVALYGLDRIAEAHAAYDKALAAAPDHVESLLNRALLLQTTGNLDAALADYEKAVSLAPV